jgi:hypothetical protein
MMADDRASDDRALGDLAPSVGELLDKLKETDAFQFALMFDDELSSEEKHDILKTTRMPWSRLHRDIIGSIESQSADTKSQVGRKTKAHTKTKMQLWCTFSKRYPPHVSFPLLAEDSTKRNKWRSLAYMLAVEFTEALEQGLRRGVPNIAESVETLFLAIVVEPEGRGQIGKANNLSCV